LFVEGRDARDEYAFMEYISDYLKEALYGVAESADNLRFIVQR